MRNLNLFFGSELISVTATKWAGLITNWSAFAEFPFYVLSKLSANIVSVPVYHKYLP